MQDAGPQGPTWGTTGLAEIQPSREESLFSGEVLVGAFCRFSNILCDF